MGNVKLVKVGNVWVRKNKNNCKARIRTIL